MRHEELFYLLALQKVEGVGDVNAKKLLSTFGSAEEIFKIDKQQFVKSGISANIIEKLKDSSIFKKVEDELRFIESSNIKVSTFQEDDYPERLKHCPDSPLLLFSSGKIDLSNPRIISIVGTRQVTGYGIDFCKKLISDLSLFNPVIVSGYALGVDIAAHLSAIENGLQTIGILAHGLNQIYPKSHRKYADSMRENGGFMTEFQTPAIPEPSNFVRRNRIVAGISEATIIIESADKGGSLITANIANDYDREVFAVPGRATDMFSQGCNRLIRTQRAHLLNDASDLIYMLNWDLKTKTKPIQKQLFVSLSGEEQIIYDFLMQNGKESLDTVAIECGFPVFKISSVLLSMELKGVVRPLPGKMFEAV